MNLYLFRLKEDETQFILIRAANKADAASHILAAVPESARDLWGNDGNYSITQIMPGGAPGVVLSSLVAD